MNDWSSTITREHACRCCANTGSAYTAFGSRHIKLCDDCANMFHAWVIGHRAYREQIGHNSHRAYLDSRGPAVTEEEWLNHFEKDRTIKAELFHITGVWLEEHKAKREEMSEADYEAADEVKG